MKLATAPLSVWPKIGKYRCAYQQGPVKDTVTDSSNDAQARREEGRSRCMNVERHARQASKEKARNSTVHVVCYHFCEDEGDNTFCVVFPAHAASSKGNREEMIQQV